MGAYRGCLWVLTEVACGCLQGLLVGAGNYFKTQQIRNITQGVICESQYCFSASAYLNQLENWHRPLPPPLGVTFLKYSILHHLMGIFEMN